MGQPTVVKAVIYDSRGRILLQHRDDKSGLPEPARWGLFGGMVEEGEAFEEALTRELLEELESAVGTIEGELFRIKDNASGILHIVYLVRCGNPEQKLHLTEGQALGWFALDQAATLPLSWLIYRYMSKILRVADQCDAGVSARMEQALLQHCSLRKKSDRVFYATEAPAALDSQSIILMKELADYKGLAMFRICLHVDDAEGIHEMLMVHTRPILVGPLKQNKTSLSYHMLEGAADILLYDDSGDAFRRIRLDSSDSSCASCVRLKADVFRSMQTSSPYAVFLEVASGPFQDNDTIWLNQSRETPVS